MEYELLESLGIIFTLGILSQWIAWKLRFPVIILLTIFGVVTGPILGILDPIKTFGPLFHPLIELAVALILFEGGLLLKFHEFKKAPKVMLRLFSFAVILNFVFGSLACHYIGSLAWGTSFLIAGILIVTGPTVIIPALREAKLQTSTSSYLKWEGIINDPIGAIIAVMVYEYIIFSGKGGGIGFIFLSLFKIVIMSISLAFCTRFLFIWLSKRALVPEFLKLSFLLSIILIIFILAEHLQKGAGLLTVTLFGILLGNSDYSSLKEVKSFGESISVFTVSAIFILLSASIDIKTWEDLSWKHFLVITIFSFLIRPIGIFLATIKSSIKLNERILIGLYGPRGIVAASVAGAVGTGLYDIGYAEGRLILPIIFSVIFLTVIFHSLWLKILADKLGLRNLGEHGVLIVGASPWTIQLAKKLIDHDILVLIADTSWYKLAPTKLTGIKSHFGNVIQDLELGEFDISSFNYFISATEEDHYNSLLCHKLRHIFGREHVYQIPKHEDELTLNHDLGKKAFSSIESSDIAFYENMIKKYHHGWNFFSTTLTEKFSYNNFLERSKPLAIIPLILLKTNKRVILIENPTSLIANIGDTVIYYSKGELR